MTSSALAAASEAGPDRRLRVMQVVLSLEPGGTERLVIEIVKRLASSVASVVCCLDRPGGWAEELTSIGVPVVTLRRRGGFEPRLGRQIERLAAAHGVDVLHCHHYTPFVYGQLAALLRRSLKVVFTEHGRLSDAAPSLKRQMVNPLLGLLPSAVMAVSEGLAKHMRAEGFVTRRVQVVHNGIHPGERPTTGGRWAARQQLGLPADALVIGAAGRLDPVKDLLTLVDAFAAVHRRRPRSQLVLIGDGPARRAVAERVAALGLEDAVSLTGYRPDVRALLPAVDIYANSSIHEGVSLTILEAMAAELPVVATAVGGTPEVVVDGETGWLVAPRSPNALAAAIDRLSAAPDQRRAMGHAGRFRVKRHFDLTTMASRYLEAYRGRAEV